MQLQLGEGSGDQERTIVGIKSMSTAQLGRIEVTQQFDKSKAVIETKTLSIQDVMGIVPKGVHEWEKFVTPDELRQSLESSGCRVLSTCGLIYDPLCNRWSWTAFDGNNYALLAEKLPNTK